MLRKSSAQKGMYEIDAQPQLFYRSCSIRKLFILQKRFSVFLKLVAASVSRSAILEEIDNYFNRWAVFSTTVRPEACSL